MNGRLNTVKLFLVPKEIYRLNATLAKFQQHFSQNQKKKKKKRKENNSELCMVLQKTLNRQKQNKTRKKPEKEEQD